MSNGLAEYNPQMESFEYDFEAENSESGVFNESEEMELAAELLEVRDEAELEQFLGDLIKKAGSAIGKVVKSPIGQAIGGVLKAAAKKALPLAGSALGRHGRRSSWVRSLAAVSPTWRAARSGWNWKV